MANPSRQYQQISDETVIFRCKAGRCVPPGYPAAGKSVNGLNDEQLAELDLRVYVAPPAPPYVHTLEQRVEQLDQACRAHIDKHAHWTSAVMVSDKAKAEKPKAKAVETWANNCWLQFYGNEALLTEDLANWAESMLTYPDCPHSMKEVMQEV